VYGTFRDAVVEGIEDPAVVFAVSFRMTGRLQRRIPELVRVILNTGTAILHADRGLGPRARADIAAAIEAERFTISSPEIGFYLAGGALLGLLQLLEDHPELDDAQASDEMTERMLVVFDICARALPELDNLATILEPSA
jgi:hypothetical protein